MRDRTGVVYEHEIQVCSLDLVTFSQLKEIMDEERADGGSNYLRMLILNEHKLILNWMTSFETQILPALSKRTLPRQSTVRDGAHRESPELLRFLQSLPNPYEKNCVGMYSSKPKEHGELMGESYINLRLIQDQ